MPRLYLIRHGEPATTWGDGDPDPGLSALGRAQAADTAYKLGALKPKRIVTSPLLRCRETAAALEMESGLTAATEPLAAEIATPRDIADRRAWLSELLAGDWASYPDFDTWRSDLISRIVALEEDAAIFSHFVAINVLVGAARGETKATVFRPAHASITTLDVEAGRLRIAALGAETAALTAL